MDETVFLAHIAEDGREQTVDEHERGTAELCAKFATQFGAEEYAKLEAMRHDDGKNTQGFQRRLRGGPAVDHSTAGAFECFRANAVHEAICIAGHHGGLPDVGNAKMDTPEDGTFFGRMKKAMSGGIEEPLGMDRPITALPRPNFYGDRFYESVWIKMLYSCLVDADYLDTESFMSGGKATREEYDDMATLLAYFEKHIAPWANPQSELNKKRWEILSACLAAGEGPKGIYTLSTPTGSGKTTASLAFALKHAVKHNMQRIIYVIPYTSIIDQNAKVFREILHDKNVLEHHSGIVFDKEDKKFDSADYKSALAAENWDAPVVVTTAVQFFESFYANRSSKCRKLHNVTNSVIIFDEAQMMPSENLLPCVAAISTLCAHFNSTAVLCTATQPVVDDYIVKYAPNIAIKEICPEVRRTYEQFKRVTFEQAGELDDVALAARLGGHEQVLCIVNSRKAAQAVFNKLPKEGRFHLSTLMYPEHRQKTIDIIRQRLTDGEVCRVVSTSLIEAGVDIDFPTVYREMAGLDSILQAAGRCNREGKRSRKESMVTVFTGEHRAPRMLETNISAANSAMRGEEDIDSPEVVRKYFNTYRAYLGDGTDKARVVEAFENDKVYGMMPFKTVAEKFRIIDQNTRTVYIPLGKGVESIARLRNGEKSRKLFREAGRYGVTIYENQFETLYYSGCIEMIDDENAVLINTGVYDEKMGLRIEESSDANFMI